MAPFALKRTRTWQEAHMKKRWTKGGGAIAAAVIGAAGGAGPASAQDFGWSPGVFIDFTIGQTWNVGLGVDFRGSVLFQSDSCFSQTSQSGVGVYAQAVWLIHGNTSRVSAGLHGGFQKRRDGVAWDFELGWMWQGAVSAQPGGHGLQVGLLGSQIPLDAAARFNLFNDGAGWVPEGHLAVGGRVPGPFASDGGFCVEGRPQRDGGGLCMGRVFVRGGHFKRRDVTSAVKRAAIGVEWVEAARAEAASIPAFMALARDLTRADAPQTLVTRALVAAGDEVRHARACAKIAQRYLGRPVAVEVPQLLVATQDSSPTALLSRLAVESWKDGCLGEGEAAARAGTRVPLAVDRLMKRSLATIAREEATHAGLAWDVLSWATKTGGTPVREAVAKAVAASGEAPTRTFDSQPAARGQLSAAAKAQIAEAVRSSATERWRTTS